MDDIFIKFMVLKPFMKCVGIDRVAFFLLPCTFTNEKNVDLLSPKGNLHCSLVKQRTWTILLEACFFFHFFGFIYL